MDVGAGDGLAGAAAVGAEAAAACEREGRDQREGGAAGDGKGSELLPIAGIDYIGPLPAEVQRVTVFSAGVATGSKQPDAARQLIRYLNSPAAAPTIAKTGLEPLPAR